MLIYSTETFYYLNFYKNLLYSSYIVLSWFVNVGNSKFTYFKVTYQLYFIDNF